MKECYTHTHKLTLVGVRYVSCVHFLASILVTAARQLIEMMDDYKKPILV